MEELVGKAFLGFPDEFVAFVLENIGHDPLASDEPQVSAFCVEG